MRMRSIAFAAVGALALALATGVSAQILPAGKAAPKWSGKTVAGKAISSTQYKGKVVLLNFFNNY
jgi:hypothetical protein